MEGKEFEIDNSIAQMTEYNKPITCNDPNDGENNQENINCNRNMNKNRIRLTESQLHKVIRESVKRALNEENGFSCLGHMRDAIEDAIYSTINDLAAKKAIEEGQLNMMKQSLSRFVCDAFEGACRQLLQRPDSSFYNSLHDGEFLPPSAY